MHTWGSGRFLGIDRDAHHVADAITTALRRDNPGTHASPVGIAS
jgi:hypothetical protein